jgi:hypothetical protein
MKSRLTLNSLSSCLSLPRAGITGMYHHAQLYTLFYIQSNCTYLKCAGWCVLTAFHKTFWEPTHQGSEHFCHPQKIPAPLCNHPLSPLIHFLLILFTLYNFIYTVCALLCLAAFIQHNF